MTIINYSPDSNKVGPTTEIELYPHFLNVALVDCNTGQPRPFQQHVPVSKFKPLHLLVADLCKLLQYNDEGIRGSVRLWKVVSLDDGNEEIQLLDLNISLREQKKNQDQTDDNIVMLLLEIKNDQGEWPRGNADPNNDAEKKSKISEVSLDVDAQVGDGIIGLYNMGNTCYLNSSIQCLSHTPLLRQYFTSKAYLKDINTTNIFGHQGRIAQVSAVLINELWKPHGNRKSMISMSSTHTDKNDPIPCPSLTPKSFKEAIGKFNEQFAGNDAQELLSYLLAGLSED